MSELGLLAVVLSLALLYLVASRLFASAWYGGLTAAMFAATPLLWYQLRDAPASLFPLPFVLAWLLAAQRLGNTQTKRWAAVAGIALGLGVYTSTAAAIMMPLYLVVTVVVFAATRATTPPELAALVGGFGAASLPFGVTIARHSEELRAEITAHHLYDAMRFNLLQGLHEMASWVGLTARSAVYYDYLNPAFLFFTGRVLLLPLAVLIPIGVYRILTAEATPFARLSLAGFLAAPLAAALTAEPPVPARIVFIVAFAAIVSAYGVRHLQTLRRVASNSFAR